MRYASYNQIDSVLECVRSEVENLSEVIQISPLRWSHNRKRLSVLRRGLSILNRIIKEKLEGRTVNSDNNVCSMKSVNASGLALQYAVREVIKKAYSLNRQDIMEEFSHIAKLSTIDLAEAMWKLKELASCTVAPEDLCMIVLLAQELWPSMRQEDRMCLTGHLLHRIIETLTATSVLSDILLLSRSARTLMNSDGQGRAAEWKSIVIDRVLQACKENILGSNSHAPELQPRTNCGRALEYVLLMASRTKEAANVRLLYQAAGVLAEIVPPDEALQAVGASLYGLSKTGDEGVALSIAELLAASLRNVRDEDYVRELLNLLKFPASVGKATEYVLQRLRERFPALDQPHLDLWTVVAWAEKTFPEVDLASPSCLPLVGAVGPEGPFA